MGPRWVSSEFGSLRWVRWSKDIFERSGRVQASRMGRGVGQVVQDGSIRHLFVMGHLDGCMG